MNTPKPCYKCSKYYYDPCHKNDPNYSGECVGDVLPKNGICPKYDNWESEYYISTEKENNDE